ncbi:MAG: DUF1993 domain-containing protein [Pseudomonadota bacterium]
MTQGLGLTALLVPTYRQMLTALGAWLDKAGEDGARDDALMARRLAPDMLPLAAQVRFACLQAREAPCRLTGAPMPDAVAVLGREGQGAGAAPGTIAEARAHVDATLAHLAGLAPDALDAWAARPVAIELPNGMVFDMDGAGYARDWALPQFYFHLNAAYAILRAAGVPLGKADYVQHAFASLRPGTMPQGAQG